LVRSNYKKIFGGYADQTWNATSNYKASSKCFIFSLTEKEKFINKNSTYGIYANHNYGPTFGGGHDFYLCNNCNTTNSSYSNFGHSYEAGKFQANKNSALAGAYNFMAEEVEVFELNTKPFKTTGGFDSKLIKSTDFETLYKWINNGKKVTLDLLYRGTKDGFDAADFHSKCDKKGPNLVVCKSKTHNKIFGGFNSKSWSTKGDYVDDPKAFLFSLTHKTIMKPIASDCALYCSNEYGPVFGAGYDLLICTNSNVIKSSSSTLGLTYSSSGVSGDSSKYLAGDTSFLLDEIEVFRVVF